MVRDNAASTESATIAIAWGRKRLLKTLRTSARRRLTRWRRRALVRRGYRIVRVSFPNRIGHLCVEIDALLKQTILAGGDTRMLYLPDIGNGFANRHLVDYFNRYLTVGPDLGLPSYLQDPNPETRHRLDALVDTHPYAVAMYATATAYRVFAEWGDRPPLFQLTEEDVRARNRYFRDVGVPEDAWFVCLHAREGGYSAIDEAVHRYRSIAVESFTLAVDEIIRRGGWVIRMGDPSMKPFAPNDRVIDYATSAKKSAPLDVALAGGCRFFLGSSSGLYSLAGLFGVPCAVAHMAPLGGALPFSPADISIPQHLVNAEGRTLPLREVMSDERANYRLDAEFTEKGMKHLPNSPEEIRDLVIEMFERLEGSEARSEDDTARQAEFHSLLREGHYSFGASSSMGREFLRRHL